MASFSKYAIKTLLFVFLAIPGAFACVFFGIFLVGNILAPGRAVGNPMVLAALYVLGAICVIVGVGKYGQWLYGLVFLSMPLTLFAYAFLNPRMIGGLLPLLMIVGGVAGGMYSYVKKYFDRQALSLPDQESDRQQPA